MSIKDIIKNSVLNSLSIGVGVFDVFLILALACCAGVYLYFVYRSFSKSAFYSRDLNVSIAGITIVVAAIMVAIQSSLVVSLGMVGALSIVRFRTAIKNPLDLLYMFWAISCGIIIGIKLYILAAILCVIMTLLVWLLGAIPNVKAPFVLVVKAETGADREAVDAAVKAGTTYAHLASVRVYGNDMELIFEVKSRDTQALVLGVSAVAKVKGVNCIEHDGELRV